MAVNARQVALEMVENILDKGAYANLEAYRDLNRTDLSEMDKRFALEITYGTTKHWNTLDWVLEKFMNRPMDKVQPYVRNVLRIGAYQILYMDRVPASAACNESVKLVKKHLHQGAAGFVNGVLRSLARNYESIEGVEFPDPAQDLVGHISLKYSFPPWMVERWLKNFGTEETIAICRYHNTVPLLGIRVNTLQTSMEEFTAVLEEKEIPWSPGEIWPQALIIKDYGKLDREGVSQSLYLTQSETSMLVSPILQPKAGMSVLDTCSAPGTKTTHLAQLMGDKGRILAVDIHEHRLDLVKKNCRRLGIKSVETLLSDAREIADKTQQLFDCILVDAPCTGTGVLNRRADARWRRNPQDVESMSTLQREILDKVIPSLKPGGRLVYSTCSLEPEENQEVLKAILETHPELKGDPFGGELPHLGFEENAFAVQLAPHIHGTDGFFISRFTKSL